MLQSMGSQRVRHDLATEQQQYKSRGMRELSCFCSSPLSSFLPRTNSKKHWLIDWVHICSKHCIRTLKSLCLPLSFIYFTLRERHPIPENLFKKKGLVLVGKLRIQPSMQQAPTHSQTEISVFSLLPQDTQTQGWSRPRSFTTEATTRKTTTTTTTTKHPT